MKKVLFVSAALMLTGVFGSAVAGDAAAGAAKYAMCGGCHGANGEGMGPNPKLAGQSAEQIKEALVAYKTGTRKNGTMQAMSAGLSDADIDNIAAHVAAM